MDTSTDEPIRTYFAYTDGSCPWSNPGFGGHAYVLEAPNGITTEYAASDDDPDSTNNRQEMLAAIAVMENLPADADEVIIYSDSQYLVKGYHEWLEGWVEKGWRNGRGKPLPNVDLWETLKDLTDNHKALVQFDWVRAHKGNPGNERADQLAKEMGQKAVNGELDAEASENR